jgi:hypothetical protein
MKIRIVLAGLVEKLLWIFYELSLLPESLVPESTTDSRRKLTYLVTRPIIANDVKATSTSMDLAPLISAWRA